MTYQTTRRAVAPWLPAIFCAFLSLFPLMAISGFGGGWWQPAYYSFLPMCFFYAGAAQREANLEIYELRKRMAAMESKPAV